MNKSKIRSKILKLRGNNCTKNYKISPKTFFSFLKAHGNNLNNIGGYYPSNFEIDDLEILELLDKKNYRISLPVIKKNYQIDFYKWSINDPLKVNKYGIPEPSISKLIYPDILLVPLVAFDNDFNRLGYGGGFYDRYIEKVEKIKKIIKIGLAFSYQRLKHIPINQYDKKLDFIITEKEVLK